MIPWNNCLAGIGIGTPFSDEDKRLKKFTGKNTSATKFFSYREMKRDLLLAASVAGAADALKGIKSLLFENRNSIHSYIGLVQRRYGQ